MDFSLFIKPLDGQKIIDYMSVPKTLGSQVYFYKGGEVDGDYKVAILGIQESRGGEMESVENSPNYFRDYLYKLFPSWVDMSIIDLGNVIQGNELRDSYFALSDIIHQLVSQNIIPVVIGGSNDLAYGLYKGYERLEQMVNLVTIDRKIDLDDDGIANETYLKDIILSNPNYLFNYTNIGSQAYYLNPDVLDLIDKLHFENIRLGEFQTNSQLVEPYLRNADIVSFDLNAIRQSEVPGTSFASPNGLYGNEACQIARYAGISDRLSSIGFFEATPEFDLNGQTFSLLAQMIWYFIDGVANRKKESPLSSDINYTQYKVILTDTQEELMFIKSNKSDRWWMRVPYPPSQKIKFERHHLVPCDYNDYQKAMADEMPDLWIKTYKKINVV